MKREDLKKLGLADDVIDSIMSMHGADVETHKTKLATAEGSITTLQSQLEAANKQIEDFKGMKIDEIQAAANDYKAKFEKAQADAATQIAQIKFDHALDGALTGAKAKDAKSVKAHLDLASLKLKDDGTIDGLDKQLETIRTEKDYLFDGDTKTPKLVTKTTNQTVLNDPQLAAMRQGAGLATPNSTKE